MTATIHVVRTLSSNHTNLRRLYQSYPNALQIVSFYSKRVKPATASGYLIDLLRHATTNCVQGPPSVLFAWSRRARAETRGLLVSLCRKLLGTSGVLDGKGTEFMTRSRKSAAKGWENEIELTYYFVNNTQYVVCFGFVISQDENNSGLPQPAIGFGMGR